MEAFSTSREWMSSVEASRSCARISPTPGREPVSKGPGRVFGGSSLGSLGNYDPATSSLRTCQLSLLEGSMSCLLILPRSGLMRSGDVCELRMLGLLIGGTGSGLLPTPRSTDGTKGTRTAEGAAREFERGRNVDLGMVVAMWPTPMTTDHKQNASPAALARKSPSLGAMVHIWPTSNAAKAASDMTLTCSGETAVAVAEQAPGSLNPAWVEWLMGFPPGWTDTGTPSPPTPPGLP